MIRFGARELEIPMLASVWLKQLYIARKMKLSRPAVRQAGEVFSSPVSHGGRLPDTLKGSAYREAFPRFEALTFSCIRQCRGAFAEPGLLKLLRRTVTGMEIKDAHITTLNLLDVE